MTVNDVPRKTFFFAPRGEYRSLIFRVVAMEYRSMPTHVAVAGRTLLDHELCKTASPASDFRCFFELFCLTIALLSDLSFKVKEHTVQPNILSPDLFCSRCECRLGKLRVQSHRRRSSSRVVVRRRGKPACTWRFCLVSSQGRASLT